MIDSILVAALDRPRTRRLAREPIVIAVPSSEPEAGLDEALVGSPEAAPVPSVARPQLPGASLASADETAPRPSDLDPGRIELDPRRAAPVALRDHYAAVVTEALDGISLAARHRALRRFDERGDEETSILELVDAVVACPRFGEVLPPYAHEALDAPDPWRIFGPLFTVACLEGADVGPALAALLAPLAEDDHARVEVAAEALALAPHADLLGLLRDLGRDAHPGPRAVAVGAMGLLRALDPDAVLEAMASEVPCVRRAAARAAADVVADRRVDEALLASLHQPGDREDLWTAARSLALRGLPAGYFAARLDPAWAGRLGGRVIDLVALLGEASDATLVRSAIARAGRTPAVITALGRLGHPGAAAVLVEALGDEDAADGCVRALSWIFGPPPTAAAASDPAHWRRIARRLGADQGVRLRFGAPWQPDAGLDAAHHAFLSRDDVAWILDEAVIRTGVAERAAPWRWSPEADASIAPVRTVLERHRTTFTPDTWTAKTRRGRS